MNCIGCNSDQTVENAWGNWCDACGGVMMGDPQVLFFRHVATVHGKAGRFPIVFDVSAGEYGVAWPRVVPMVKCIHCGCETPGERQSGLNVLDDLRARGYYSKRGSLDAMVAFIQPVARGTDGDLPELSVAPTATDRERAILGF